MFADDPISVTDQQLPPDLVRAALFRDTTFLGLTDPHEPLHSRDFGDATHLVPLRTSLVTVGTTITGITTRDGQTIGDMAYCADVRLGMAREPISTIINAAGLDFHCHLYEAVSEATLNWVRATLHRYTSAYLAQAGVSGAVREELPAIVSGGLAVIEAVWFGRSD